MYKMYAVMSMEAVKKMNGIQGKMITQGGHAYVHAGWDADKRFPEAMQAYKDSDHARKITVRVDTDAELFELLEAYKKVCGVSLVKDSGFTVFSEPTITCLGIGPIHESDIGEDLKALKLFS